MATPREGEQHSEHDLILPSESLPNLQAKCVARLQGMTPEEFLNQSNAEYLLWAWREWDANRGWESLVSRILDHDSLLPPFLALFVATSEIWTAGDRVATKHQKFRLDELGQFCDPREVQARVDRIERENQDLSDPHRKLIALFKNSYTAS